MEDARPLFVQIAESIEDQIVSGALLEGAMVPSTNALASFYRINPATAGKGMRLLQDEGVIEKRRGLGMFVTTGARERLLTKRRSSFKAAYVVPMLTEASALGLSRSELNEVIDEASDEESERLGALPIPTEIEVEAAK